MEANQNITINYYKPIYFQGRVLQQCEKNSSTISWGMYLWLFTKCHSSKLSQIINVCVGHFVGNNDFLLTVPVWFTSNTLLDYPSRTHLHLTQFQYLLNFTWSSLCRWFGVLATTCGEWSVLSFLQIVSSLTDSSGQVFKVWN